MGEGESPLSWEPNSLPLLAAVGSVMNAESYLSKLSMLWGQESSRQSAVTELRSENVMFSKTLGRTSPLILCCS